MLDGPLGVVGRRALLVDVAAEAAADHGVVVDAVQRQTGAAEATGRVERTVVRRHGGVEPEPPRSRASAQAPARSATTVTATTGTTTRRLIPAPTRRDGRLVPTVSAARPRPAARPGRAGPGSRPPARRRGRGSRRTACCRGARRAARRARTTSGRWSAGTASSARRHVDPSAAATSSSVRVLGSAALPTGTTVADPDPVERDHRSQRAALGAAQRGDVGPRAVVVLVVARPARLLGAERHQHDRQPGPVPLERLGQGEHDPDARGVVLGARALRDGVEVGADQQPRLTGHHVALRRDHVDRRAGLERHALVGPRPGWGSAAARRSSRTPRAALHPVGRPPERRRVTGPRADLVGQELHGLHRGRDADVVGGEPGERCGRLGWCGSVVGSGVGSGVGGVRTADADVAAPRRRDRRSACRSSRRRRAPGPERSRGGARGDPRKAPQAAGCPTDDGVGTRHVHESSRPSPPSRPGRPCCWPAGCAVLRRRPAETA